MNTSRNPNRRQPIDPLLQQRRQAPATPRSAPLPPPTPAARPRVAAAGASADADARLAALAARGNGKPAAGAATKPGGRRTKPARAAKLAALALSAVTTLGLAGLFAGQDGNTDSIQLTNSATGVPLITIATTATTATTAATATTSTTTATTTAAASAVSPGANAAGSTTVATAAPTVAAAPAGVIEGTYVGASDSNRWGVVQVQVVYSGGQVSDVQILQYPNADNKSVRINQVALPTLISEAISSQTAAVSTVSGATYTSNSYKISLQSAIDAAKTASGISA